MNPRKLLVRLALLGCLWPIFWVLVVAVLVELIQDRKAGKL